MPHRNRETAYRFRAEHIKTAVSEGHTRERQLGPVPLAVFASTGSVPLAVLLV